MKTVAYAYKNTPELMSISSSGGAFLGIVETFSGIAGRCNECVVYGAKWTDDFRVVHDRADNFADCKQFCGSKYVQSDLGLIFKKVEDDLRQQNAVLFSGTPCQIGSLKAYLTTHNSPQEQLLTVDIACHGAPQSHFWNEYKSWLESKEGSKIKAFSFRYKPKGWKGYPILVEFENGKRYENAFHTSHYMTIFRKGLLIRQGCFNCKYPGNFQSDITIADFWGVELCMPEIPVSGGVSLILCHTQKGKDIAESMKAFPVPDERYLEYNHNLSKCTGKPKTYDQFWNDYHNEGLEYVLRKYGGNSMKGMLRFYAIRFLRDSGLMALGKRILKRA